MWLPLIAYLLVNIKYISPLEPGAPNEPAELIDLFIENLKVDLFLLDDHNLSEKSKRFINNKIDKFFQLVSRSQNAEFSRTKRSLDHKETQKYSINISPQKIIPTQFSDDIRLFQHEDQWFAVSLEDKRRLAIYQYTNESFHEILQKDIHYTINVAVLPTDNKHLIVIGDNDHIKVFEFNFNKNELDNLQTIKVSDAKHVVLWEQDHSAYLSITQYQEDTQKSYVKIYQWLGKHFDHVQDFQFYNIKKTVPFNIHGSYFLAVVKCGRHEDEDKSYSEILRFDMHAMQFEPYQKLLTDECTDIKYFTSELHGENHNFLIVVHSLNDDPSKGNDSISVIYKYEDRYFIPFQSIVTDAVEWQPVQDLNGNAALVAVANDGLKGFQYDGWHFFENHIESDADHIRFEDIKTIHPYIFDGEQILVIACDHCKNTTNIYSVNFTNYHSVQRLHSELLLWCTNSLKELELHDESEIVAESLRGDLSEQISEEEDQQRQLSAALTESSETLYNIEDTFEHALHSEKDIFIDDIEAETIYFNNDTTVNSLHTPSINEINIDNILNNVLNIEDGFVINDLMEFGVIIVENTINPEKMNAISMEHYMTLTNDANLKNLTVHGTVSFTKGLNVKNSIDDISVTKKNLLLKDGDQTFKGNLTTNEIAIDKLTTQFLNGINLKSHNKESQEISHIKHLKVKNLEIGGLLNRVSVPVLARRALKKVGNQVMSQPFSFDSLTVNSINVGGNISGRLVPEDFVLIDSGEYTVNQDVKFLKDLKTNKLEVLDSINNILVTNDGGLDILLTDAPYIQYLPMKKTFENLIITNPIKLRNKINNAQLQRLNPVIIDTDSYELKGDVTINGRAEVTRWLKVEDLKPQNGNRSLGYVFRNGAKLMDREIPMHLTFSQPLELDDVIADRVNSLNPQYWMLANSDSSQIVTGQKTFVGDVLLKGDVSAIRINDVDVHALEKEILRVEGDQEIEGVWDVDKVVVAKGITANKTHFKDGTNLKEHNRADVLEINGNLKVKNLNTKNLQVKGLVNTQNISDILKNLVKKDAKYKVFGEKTFKELHVEDLIIQDKNSEILQILQHVLSNQITLNGNLDLFNNISISNLEFNKNINGVPRETFDDIMNLQLNVDDTATVSSGMEYDEIVVLGEVFIEDNFINGKNLTSIEQDTVKVDEDHEFQNVRIGEVVTVNNTLNLDGNIENLDVNSIVQANSNNLLSIQDKIFMGHVYIDGTLLINKTVNGMDLKKFCMFSDPSEQLKTLKIEGDVVFVRGPKILNLNYLSVNELKETLWFSDRPASISGNVHLKNTTFNKSIYVQDFVDGTKLNLLTNNYLSKSKKQTVPASISFDQVTVSNISTPRVTTPGRINGILLSDILKTMLIQGEPQVFESPAYLEEVEVQGLNEDAHYSVNNLNLATEVMRYDTQNIVTGRKIFKNLNAEVLRLTHNVKIQNVDVLDWLGHAILVDGTFNIEKKKILKSANFKRRLSVRGHLNDQTFNEETVMLVDTPQNITGKKTFFVDKTEPIKFKTLRVKGLINEINLENLVQNHTNNHQNATVSSEVIFDNNVVVKNINIDVLYNNVNVSQLISNVSKLRSLENFQKKFKDLLAMGMEVEDSVKDTTAFFKYYKEITRLDYADDLFGVKSKDGVFRLITFYWENGKNKFTTYEWNSETETFSVSGVNIESNWKPTYMQKISLRDKDYLYLEYPLDTSGYLHYKPYSGRLIQLINQTTFELVVELRRNETVSLFSFENPSLNETCLGFIDNTNTGFDIYCDEGKHHNDYYSSHRILMQEVYEGAVVQTQDSVYVFLARYREPSIVVLQSKVGHPEFVEIQTIFEGAQLNAMAAAVINDVPYVAFSFGSQAATVESGWVSVRRLDEESNKFVQWQHIPITVPLGVHFITETSFEPLLVVPSADASAPLQTFRYDGIAGFKQLLKGSSLPVSSKVRVIGNGHFLVALQEDMKMATILGAVIKGSIRN